MNTNNSGEQGLLGKIGKAFNNATSAIMPGNSTRKNNAQTLPVTAGTNIPRSMKGGMAPINYRAANMQPSEAVMKWATTAGADMPSKAEMRGVAHGGRRSRRRSGRKTIGRRYRKSKRATGGRRRKTHRRRRN
jgi:hypothetical protein